MPIGKSGIWIGDYTTEPENGGLGVFAHEFGHDLGLPDLYDTGTGGDNGTGFWTLMSGGSWMNHGGNSIGTTPDYMDPWSKLFVGWLDYEVVLIQGTMAQVKLGPAAGGSGTPAGGRGDVAGQGDDHRVQHAVLGRRANGGAAAPTT